jgi:hypothetical protein
MTNPDSVRLLAIGIAIGASLVAAGQPAGTRSVSSSYVAADSVIQVHLATYEVTSTGDRIASSPVQRAFMEFDCHGNRFRRLGADVERPNGDVEILGGQEAGYDWRAARTNDPEFLQIRASCAAR